MEKSKIENLGSQVSNICAFLLVVGFAITSFLTLSGNMPELSYIMAAVVIAFSLICAIWSCGEILKSGRKSSRRSHIPKEYESLVPTGYLRLAKSESQKTKMAASVHQRPIPGVARSLSKIDDLEYESAPKSQTPRRPVRESQEMQVRVLRGGEFIGNRMRFKVKIVNDSPYVITDVTVFLLSYPKDALKFVSDDDSVHFAKIEPEGLVSPTFDFLPTQDCVKGEIVAGVSFLDMRGQPQMRNSKPFVIRSVCDLLLPHRISAHDFELRLNELESGEIIVKIEEWTPEEMFEKALKIVDESNFFEVSSKIEETGEVVFAKIVGFALGKYTGKEVGVEIYISGPAKIKGASCKIKVSGEDQAMILPAIDDLRERLNAWLCPLCSSPLSLANVDDLRVGKVVVCPFCGVAIGR